MFRSVLLLIIRSYFSVYTEIGIYHAENNGIVESYLHLHKKVKRALVQELGLCTGRTAHRGSRGVALLFLGHDARRGEGSASFLRCSLLPGKNRYPFYRRLVGPQDRSGQVRKISPPPGFDPWTVQTVASRYTNYATRPTKYIYILIKNYSIFYCQYNFGLCYKILNSNIISENTISFYV